MGLSNDSGRHIFVNISKGKLVIKRGDEKQFFNVLEGTITGISIKDEIYQDRPYKKLCVNLNDGQEAFQLQMKLDSGYGRAFCSIIKNVILEQPVKIVPTYKEADGKKQSGLFINQNEQAVKWFFTNNNPLNRPPIKEFTINGNKVYDSTDQTAFYIEMLEMEIKPKLPHAALAGPATQFEAATTASDITEPFDDLPF